MEHICIRPAALEDVPALLDIYAPYVRETAVSFEYQVPSPEDFAGHVRRTLARYPYLVAQEGSAILGYAYAGPFAARAAYQWGAETTIYLRRDRRGKGLGRALYQTLEQILILQNIQNLNACIADPVQEEDPYLTGASAAFHAKLGYQLAGRFHRCGYKFGRWYDMIWMEKLLGSHPDQPPAVLPFPELLAQGRLSHLFS